MQSKKTYDITIIGAGIVGLAVARELAQSHPGKKIAVVEKETQVGQHQTGHNSGVIHSGLYYKPGSFKARFCVQGAELMKAYCAEHDIPYEVCGKVVVATHRAELPRLETLYERGQANGVQGLVKIGPDRLKELEPHAHGIAALLCPPTGIVDYKMVADSYARDFQEHDGSLFTGAEVVRMRRTWDTLAVETTVGDIETTHVINCAGLHSDVIARMLGARADVKIIPFRGEYYFIKPERRYLVQNLIYPVPDPAFPFLGVHFTRTVHGELEAGPNAVLAFAREGYSMTKVDSADLLGTLRFPGAWTMARKYWRTGAGEVYRSLSKKAFVRALQRLLPEVQEQDVVRGGAGVRAQAVDRRGALLDDFRIDATEHAIHVINAPSPAATSSLAIGSYIADLAAKTFRLSE